MLGKLDDALSNNYQVMSASNIGNGARKNLKSTQKQWLVARNKCTDKTCLLEAYRKRVDEICENYPVISGVFPMTCLSSEQIE